MSDLLLPRSLIDELAEQRAHELAREARAHDAPVIFQQNTLSISGLGRQPRKQDLLAATVGWAAIAARVKADRLQSLEPCVFRTVQTPDGGQEKLELRDHDAKRLLDNPGPIFSRALLMRLLSFHLDQVGEGYWQILRDGLGIPRQLWPLPPDKVDPVPSHTEVIGGYRVRANFGEVTLAREDVIRFWMPDPETLYSSMGNLGPQRTEWDADRFRLETIRSHFGDGATPRTALKATADAALPDKPQRSAFAADWVQRYHNRKGTDRAIPAFLPPGFDVVNLDQFGGINDTLEWGDKIGEQMLAAYGVPGSLVGMVVDVNRAAAETNNYVFDRNTMLPITMLVAEALTMQWVAPSYGDDVFVAYKEFVEPDKEFTLRQDAADLQTKVRVVNEVRRARGLPPQDYGDEPIGTIADEPYRPDETFSENELDLGPPRGRLRVVPTSMPVLTPVPPQLASGLRVPDLSAAATWERNLRVEQKATRMVSRALGQVWLLQRRHAEERLRELMGDGSGAGGAPPASDLFDPRQWEDLYAERVNPLLEAVAEAAGSIAFDGLVNGRAPTEFVLTDVMAELLTNRATLWQFDVSNSTMNFLERALAQGTANGDSIETLARRLDGVFLNRKRARTVARTEIGKANQKGQLYGYESSGRSAGKRWNDSQIYDETPNAVRHSHRIDGQVVALNEKFKLTDGERAEHPLDPALSVGNIVNCRCFMTPVKEV